MYVRVRNAIIEEKNLQVGSMETVTELTQSGSKAGAGKRSSYLEQPVAPTVEGGDDGRVDIAAVETLKEE